MGRLSPTAPTALVIDDEAPIRQLVHRMLDPGLCRVLDAPDAETGLRIIERDAPRVDLVLTDWVMPGLDGRDVVEVLHRYRSGLPVAVISGYTSTLGTMSGDGTHFRLLRKPFTAEQIQDVVAEMIEAARRMRDTARELAEFAARARDSSATLREQNEALRGRMDLVAAAWALHNARGR